MPVGEISKEKEDFETTIFWREKSFSDYSLFNIIVPK